MSKSKSKFVVRGPGRRMPVPGFPGAAQHIIQCRVEDVPDGMPKFNVRLQEDLDRNEYRNVKKHLLGEVGVPNMFYLQSQGIVMLAAGVRKIDERDVYEIDCEIPRSSSSSSVKYGIADGAHLYDISIEGKAEIPSINEDRRTNGAPELDQWVEFRVFVGIPPELAPLIVSGRSTSVQVQPFALMDFKGQFAWIKEALKGQPYFKSIGWTQGAEEELDVRDIIRVLELFNLHRYPVMEPGEVDSHPMRAYSSKGTVLGAFARAAERGAAEYVCLAEILPDLLTLHDVIREDAPLAWNDGGRKAGRLDFVETFDDKKEYPFIGRSGRYDLKLPALLPMLAAFRCHLVVDGPKVRWRGDFKQVVAAWHDLRFKLINAVNTVYRQEVADVTALGKCSLVWLKTYTLVYDHCRKVYTD